MEENVPITVIYTNTRENSVKIRISDTLYLYSHIHSLLRPVRACGIHCRAANKGDRDQIGFGSTGYDHFYAPVQIFCWSRFDIQSVRVAACLFIHEQMAAEFRHLRNERKT